MNPQEQYSRYAKYFVEITHQVKALKEELENAYLEGKAPSKELSSEFFRHEKILEILAQGGRDLYKKTPEELYFDGSGVWFSVDND